MTTIPWPAPTTRATQPPPHAALRTKIAWLCHLTRAAALGWAIWMLIAMLKVWGDPQRMASLMGRYLNADVGVIAPSQIAIGIAAQLVAWIPMAAVAYCIWRLFSGYLNGSIFTADAAARVWRVGIAGLTAVATSIVMRRVEWLILTSNAELPLTTRLLTQVVVPGDLLETLFSLFVLALGRVFKTAVEIADDNDSIV